MYDHLEIRNGANERSPLIGRFCGTEIMRTIKSFSNNIYLRFRSDQDSNHKGEDGVYFIFYFPLDFSNFSMILFRFYFPGFKITYDSATSG